MNMCKYSYVDMFTVYAGMFISGHAYCNWSAILAVYLMSHNNE